MLMLGIYDTNTMILPKPKDWVDWTVVGLCLPLRPSKRYDIYKRPDIISIIKSVDHFALGLNLKSRCLLT